MMVLALSLSGCGGGGGGDENENNDELHTGVEAADFTGKWAGTYDGVTLSYTISQSGNTISMVRLTPLPISTSQGITYSGTISGNRSVVNTYVNSTYVAAATWTKIDDITMTARIDDCRPPQGFSCGAVGSVLTVYKQLYPISGRVSNLPDTGQTNCYNESGAVISCAGPIVEAGG